jgi:phage gp29-like protein
MSAGLSNDLARPGTPLSKVGGLPPRRDQIPQADSAPPAKSPMPAPAPAPAQVPMSLIIRPSARDRWQSSLISQYTPTYVENICRGAMAGNLLSQWLMFDLMEQTWPRLQKNLKELKDAIIDLEWNLQPFALKGQKPSDEAQRRARILEHIIWNMDPDMKANENDFDDTIFDVCDALGKSISVLEMDIPSEPVQVNLGDTVEWVFPLQATRWVHPRYYGYPNYPVVGDELMLNAKEVKFSNPAAQLSEDDGSIWMKFPDDKFIISMFKQKSGHPINSGMLRVLGFFWAAQNFTWEWFLNFAQIFGQPIRWATYDPNALQETITLVENLLRDMGSSAYAAFPAGTDLKIIEAMKGGGENPQKVLIDSADTICDLVVLNEAMSSEHGGAGGRGGGTQASATVGKTKRDEKVHAVAGKAAKILNQQLLKPLCRINFGDDQLCPYFEPAAAQAKDGVAVATKYKTVLSIPGVVVSKQQFYEDNDLVVPGDGDDVLIGQASGGQNQNTPGGPGGPGADDPNNPDPENEGPVSGSARGAQRRCIHAHAKAPADTQIVNRTLEDLTGVSEKWLGEVKPFFHELIAKAKDEALSDADFISALAKAKKQIPELFHKLDAGALAKAFENAQGAAVVNGAVRGAVDRRKAVVA